MTIMILAFERTPKQIQFNGKSLTVEELSVKLPFSRKPATLGEVGGGEAPCRILITETKTMTSAEFDAFAARLLASREWLNGKGGYLGDARLCVEVVAPLRPILFIDPSGADYARYVARLG